MGKVSVGRYRERLGRVCGMIGNHSGSMASFSNSSRITMTTIASGREHSDKK